MSEIIKPSILPGFMELLPKDQLEFERMKKIIEETFQNYGFLPLDTPLIEREEILLSKGGGETQKQIFKIAERSRKQALRFDLTVSLARFVAQNSNELNFPFRRYQIGKVYRGERNQKGRYREFYQCDVDIIGNNNLSIYNDAEIPAVIYEIFKKLELTKINFHMNNRKLLNGFFDYLEIENKEETLRTIDKIAKIGRKETREELLDLGLNESQIKNIFQLILDNKSNDEVLEKLDSYQIDNDLFNEGVSELTTVYKYMQEFGIPKERVKLDLSITRGLDYYTGTVYETFIEGYENIGSVCSGGRYEDLASNFTKEKFPGIGLSIGLTRLYYQLKAADLISFMPKDKYIKALVLPMDDNQISYSISIVDKLRENNIRSQVYLESGRLRKKFQYADRLDAEYVIIIGEEEEKSHQVSLRNLSTGEQDLVDLNKLIEILSR